MVGGDEMTSIYPQSGLTNHRWSDAWAICDSEYDAMACRKCIYCEFTWCVTSGYWHESHTPLDKRECPASAGMILDASG
jgi:hypothetical protein